MYATILKYNSFYIALFLVCFMLVPNLCFAQVNLPNVSEEMIFTFDSHKTTSAVEGATFAIYTDNNVGAWDQGIIVFEQFLNWKGISYEEITATDVNSIPLKNYYDAIYFPGGDADYYHLAIDPNGIQHIQELVSGGGGYIGMCAGAEFACDKFVWEGITRDYQLDLFDGEAIGPINEIAIWPNYTMTQLNMNSNNPINQYEPNSEKMLYYGGSSFYPYGSTEIDTVATWDIYNDHNAIINLSYGNGRVLLVAPHPEFEEDSNRDSSTFADELNDSGTDWNFLWSGVDWLLGKSITEVPHVVLETKIFLEGPYNSIKNNMNDNLTVPTTSPYLEDARTVDSVPADIVDWILLELRETANGSAVTSKSVFLHKNGKAIIDDASSETINLTAPSGEYFLVIKHRNHLSVMSATKINLNNTTPVFYDFTTGSDKFYGSDGAIQLSN